MKPRYVYAKVIVENRKNELYAVLDYYRDDLIRWCTNEEKAKELTEALNKCEEKYQT